MIRALLMDIFEQALIVNSEGMYQVFVNLSPHVSEISVRIFKGKWEKGDNSIKDLDCYYDSEKSVSELSNINLIIREYLKEVE